MNTLITRVWHGRTKAEHADLYLEFLEKTGIPDYKSNPGVVSAEIWRQAEGDVCHFWTVTKWTSWDSIQQFCGADRDKAKYYREDAHYLLEFEEHVRHYETFTY